VSVPGNCDPSESEDRRLALCYHEAGHTAMALRLGHAFREVSIETVFDRDPERRHHRGLVTEERWVVDGIMRDLHVRLAGPLAQALCRGATIPDTERLTRFDLLTNGGASDIPVAEREADWLLRQNGCREDLLSMYGDRLLRNVRGRVARLLSEPAMWDAVRAIAGALDERETLSHTEVETLAPQLLPPLPLPLIDLSVPSATVGEVEG
jgi:hypothetical protein